MAAQRIASSAVAGWEGACVLAPTRARRRATGARSSATRPPLPSRRGSDDQEDSLRYAESEIGVARRPAGDLA